MKFAAKFLHPKSAVYQDIPHTRYDGTTFEEWRESLQFPIAVYRGLGLDTTTGKDIRTNSTGIYWSTQHSVSYGFAQMSGSEFGHEHYGVLKGIVDSEDDVDWDDIEANWSAGPEFELLLFNGTQVRDVQLSIDGGPYRPFKKSVIASGDFKAKLNALRPQLAAVAQKEYDEWDASDEVNGDFEVGFGGICHLIADAFADVLSAQGFNTATWSHTDEVHVSVMAWEGDEPNEEGQYEVVDVDLNPYIYETGGGYNWKKIPDVTIDPSDISLYRQFMSPENLEDLQNGM